jgi:predicted nucleic acid-binding protein
MKVVLDVSAAISVATAAELWQDALLLAHQLDHPVYDCLHLVLAQQHDAHLLTLDKRLRRLAEGLGIALISEP